MTSCIITTVERQTSGQMLNVCIGAQTYLGYVTWVVFVNNKLCDVSDADSYPTTVLIAVSSLAVSLTATVAFVVVFVAFRRSKLLLNSRKVSK